ncbi:hypothetical protein [Comamonas sp.]|uniref:hypothetical protein n=1 Tax=Comamonas sp. TaxID=34028 RepID=UPI00258E181F|nr:hypothetical protein [Comamonas sp.]
MKKLTRFVLAAAACITTQLAFAIVPQQGMWSIGSEVNGKPGRGIQLDRQGGNYIILSYIGYRPDGSSMFLQASGKLVNGMSFSGDLIEYKNGRSLGGQARDGEVAKNVGVVSIEFDSTSSGTVTLPGEAPKRISRFQFEDHIGRLNNSFSYRSYRANSRNYAESQATIRASDGRFSMTEVTNGSNQCQYSGDIRPTGETFSSTGTASCPGAPSTFRYALIDIKVDDYGMFSARMLTSISIDADPLVDPAGMRHLQGVCESSAPEFADGSKSRCNPQELNIDKLHQSDWISPSWISTP